MRFHLAPKRCLRSATAPPSPAARHNNSTTVACRNPLALLAPLVPIPSAAYAAPQPRPSALCEQRNGGKSRQRQYDAKRRDNFHRLRQLHHNPSDRSDQSDQSDWSDGFTSLPSAAYAAQPPAAHRPPQQLHRPPPVATYWPHWPYWPYPTALRKQSRSPAHQRCLRSATAARATGKDDDQRRTFPPPRQGLQLCVAGY